MPPSGNKKNINLALNLSLVAVGMLALAFASVPLYRLFCEITGYGGTPRQGQATASSSTILNRNITVTFNADIDPHLPWGFKPSASQLTTKIGQQTVTHYVAHNNSTEPVTGRATYNVIPFSAGPYFVKIDCFCFTEQTLQPGQSVNMPILFYIDPAIVDDPEMRDVKTITLSYTFFPVNTEPKSLAKP